MNSLGSSLCTALITPIHLGLGQQILAESLTDYPADIATVNKMSHASLMNSPTKNATRIHETFSMLMQKTGSKMQFRGALK